MAKTTRRIYDHYTSAGPRDPEDKEYLVYWIYDRNCKSPNRDGFIGYTSNPAREIKRAMRRFGVKQFKILFRGTKDECQAIECKLRPQPNIGWNIAAGGFEHGGGLAGVPKPIETRDKMSEAGFARYANTPLKVSARFKDAAAKQRARDGKNRRRAERRALGLPRD